jgi:molybdopterin/thiamine biosynthesis adenylyltransferase
MHVEVINLPQVRGAEPGEIRITARHWEQLRAHLLSDGREHAALLACGLASRNGRPVFLVRAVIELTDEDMLDAGELHLSIAPQSLARHIKAARRASATLILCHSHPFPGRIAASPIDLSTEVDLCGRVLPSRLGGAPCAALVVGPDGLDGRMWRRGAAAALSYVTVVGDHVEHMSIGSHGVVRRSADGELGSGLEDLSTARQELLWGADGQRILRGAHVAVVGCGGTGSHVVSQLTHLRVGALTLVDPDIVEQSNLSRLVGAGLDDLGQAKVDVLARHAKSINRSIDVTTAAVSVLDLEPQVLVDADVIVCATDGHGSRALLTELAQQYLVPVVDLGVEVDPNAAVFRAGGGVRVLRPGRGCLHCAQTLSPALVREEYLDDEQRTVEIERGYIRGAHVPDPSVIALNGVVASMAVLEVCQLLVGMLGCARDRVLYRAESRRVTTVAIRSDDACFVCGAGGLLGVGDARPLPTRWRAASAAG